MHVAEQDGEEMPSLAHRIRTTHPRDLLRRAMPTGAPTLYKLLGRASVPAWSLQQYRDLDVVSRSTTAAMLLEASRVTPDLVDQGVALMRADPIVWNARKAFPHAYEQTQLAAAVEVLRSLGVLRDLADLPPEAGRKAVYRRVKADLARARCPADMFPVLEGWARIKTVGDLWALGERLSICLRPRRWGSHEYVVGLVNGDMAFLHHAEVDAVAQVEHVTGNLWTIRQVSGHRNRSVPRDVVVRLEAALRAAGFVLIGCGAQEALGQALRHDKDDDGDDDLGDVEDPDGGEEVDVAA
ncbi:hypothetical protein [Roseomonas harenae]|uniref:hypothetical protein n=1 Tax=Muricoccus harenae TaxID=2692566 RepID=UPI00133193DC|nr:hypothetical protein [Roseomonas harenae]